MITIPQNAQRDINCYNVLVTRELALEWMGYNFLNRLLNNLRVNNISRLMNEGKWTNSGQPIILGEKVVLDGQHRLAAIIHSNIPQMMTVLFNQNESCLQQRLR